MMRSKSSFYRIEVGPQFRNCAVSEMIFNSEEDLALAPDVFALSAVRTFQRTY